MRCLGDPQERSDHALVGEREEVHAVLQGEAVGQLADRSVEMTAGSHAEALRARQCVIHRELSARVDGGIEHRRADVHGMRRRRAAIPTLIATENVDMALEPLGLDRAQRRTRVAEALAHVGLDDRGDHLPTELSGGQQQHVAIARAIVKRPRVLLADEHDEPVRPAILYGVDTRATDQIRSMAEELGEEEIVLVGGSVLTTQAAGPKTQADESAQSVFRRTAGRPASAHRLGDGTCLRQARGGIGGDDVDPTLDRREEVL